MAKSFLLTLLLLACIHSLLSQTVHEVQSREDCRERPLFIPCASCNVQSRRFGFNLTNFAREPTMHSVTFGRCNYDRTILNYMERMARPDFNFTLSLTDPNFGYAVTGIKNVFNDDEAYWAVLDGNKNPLTVGVDRYEPKNNEVVTFLYTRR